MANVFVEYWDVFLVYGLAVILLYVFRSRFEFQGIVALLRTKVGLNFMKRTGERFDKFWHGLGLVSITIGFLFMILITGYLLWGFYALFFVPNAPPTLSPFVPGVKIPGVPIVFPLWYSLIALFFAVVIHEAAHGVFASAYRIKIKSSGLAAIGPLPGAFVEPDEKVLSKRPARQQLAMLSAGPFSNVVLALIAVALLALVSFGMSGLVVNEGVQYQTVQNNTAAYTAGFPAGGVITAINSVAITNSRELTTTLGTFHAGDRVDIYVNKTAYSVTLGAHPDDADRAYLGILGAQTVTQIRPDVSKLGYTILFMISELFLWIYVVSFGIGIANLIPAGPLDGGRMFLLALEQRMEKKRARKFFVRWSIGLLVLIVFLVFVPILRAIF